MIPQVYAVPVGTKGFDCEDVISTDLARQFRQKDFKYVYRYIRRDEPHTFDLTAKEVVDILMGGLAVGIVQHVESADKWIPSAEKGVSYGGVAVDEMSKIGIPLEVTPFCDLEGVDIHVPHDITKAYCTNWFNKVAGFGYDPGLYVGYHCGLTPEELWELPFKHYWGAYNLNRDQEPLNRGLQMKQHEVTGYSIPSSVDFGIDVNIVTGDVMGGFPNVLGPEEW